MKNLIIFVLFSLFSFSGNAQNIFEINAAESVDEIRKIVKDKDFKKLFGEISTLEVVKSHYIGKSIRDGSALNYIVQYVIEHKEHDDEVIDTGGELFDLRLLNSFNEQRDITLLESGFLKEYPETRWEMVNENNELIFTGGEVFAEFKRIDKNDWEGVFGFADSKKEEATLKLIQSEKLFQLVSNNKGISLNEFVKSQGVNFIEMRWDDLQYFDNNKDAFNKIGNNKPFKYSGKGKTEKGVLAVTYDD